MTTGKVIWLMGLFVALGFPMVWYLWGVLNDLLSGYLDGTRVLVAVPVAAVFLGLLVVVGRAVERWDRGARE